MTANKIPRGGRADSKASHEGKKSLSDSHKLDQALDDSFPGSDPVSLTQPTGRNDTPQKSKD